MHNRSQCRLYSFKTGIKCLTSVLVSVFFFSTGAAGVTSDDILSWKKIESAEFIFNPEKPDFKLVYLHSLYQTSALIYATGEVTDSGFQAAHRQRKLYMKDMLSSPFKKFYLGELALHAAIVHALADRKVQAFLELRKAFALHEENLKAHPGFTPSLKTVGTVRVLAGLMPDKFNRHAELVGLDANIPLGMKQLEAASAHPLVKLESLLILAMLRQQAAESDDLWSPEFDRYIAKHPCAWPLIHTACEILLKRGLNEKAFDLIEKCTAQERSTAHLLRIKGEIFLRKGNYGKSKKYFSEFVKEYPGNDFIKDAYYKQAVCEQITGNEAKALQLLTAITADRHRTRFVSDKYALATARSKTLGSAELLAARYYLDGGYVTRADSVLQSYRPKTGAEQKEKYYRLAQAAHLQGKPETEKKLLHEVLKLCRLTDTDYLCPVSSLKLGRLYARESAHEKAQFYFQQAIGYKNHPYKEETDRSARQEISKLP